MRARYGIMFFTIMGALACAVFGIEEYRLAQRSSKEPEEVSLKKVLERGAAGNPHIILTDFAISDTLICDKRITGEWKKVWVPIAPVEPGSEVNTSTSFRALIFSDRLQSNEAVQQQLGVAKLRCMVDSHASQPGILDAVRFKREYPQTNLSNCIILVAGKTPAGIGTLVLYGVGCLSLVALTCMVWVVAKRLDAGQAAEQKKQSQTQVHNNSEESSEEPIVLLEDDEPQWVRTRLGREVLRQRILGWMRTRHFSNYLSELHVTPGTVILGLIACLFMPHRINPGILLKNIKTAGLLTPLLRRRYRKLAESGEVVMAMTWMANSALISGDVPMAPALLVMCAEGSPEAEEHTQRIYFKMMGRAKEASASDEKLISAMLADEIYVRSRVRPLPASFSENRPVYLVDAKLHRAAISGGELIQAPFIVCLFHPTMKPCILPIPIEAFRDTTE